MRYCITENSKIILMLLIISSVTLSTLVVGVTNSISHTYQYAYAAANNSTMSASSTSSTGTSAKTDTGRMHLIVIDKTNSCSGCPTAQPSLSNTKIRVYDDSANHELLKEIIPSISVGNHYDVFFVPVGHRITVESTPLGRCAPNGIVPSPGHFVLTRFDQAYLVAPAYTGPICGTIGRAPIGTASCTIDMPAQGPGQAYAIQIADVNHYERGEFHTSDCR
jgi:hypothetical protein